MGHLDELMRMKFGEAARQVAIYAPLVAGSQREIAAQRRQQGFSLGRTIGECGNGGLRDGLEGEVCGDAARAAGQAHDPARPLIPWSVFTRDMDVGTASAGGYLVGTDVVDVIDILRPWSVAARAGIEILPSLRGNVTIPRAKTTTTGYWLIGESTQTTESAPTLGSIAMTPKSAGDMLELSRQLQLQTPQADMFIRRELLRTIGTLVDVAVFNGSGSSGQPLGLLNTTGIGATAGASLDWDDVLGMQQTVAEANADDAGVSFIATPAVRKLLSGRERIAGTAALSGTPAALPARRAS